MNLMLQPLRKYAEFSGRARRKEYWLFILFYVLVSVTAQVADAVAFGVTEYGITWIIIQVALFIPYLAVSVRRLHDTGRSDKYLILLLVPILGWIALLVFYLSPGVTGSNKYGPNPKEATGEAAPTFG